MDIYTAKSSVEKLLKYVEGVADSQPKMYKKSKERLEEIALTCQQVVRVISGILQEELLQDELDEDTSSTSNLEVDKLIRDIRSEVDALKAFVSYKPEVSNQLVHISASLPAKSKISKEVRKRTMASYKDTLSTLSDNCKSYPAAYECANLLYRWFDYRFYRSIQLDPNFRYNIRRIPSWIYDIVIVYAKHLEAGTCDEFIHHFDAWCNDLLDTAVPCNWAIPYEVFLADSDKSCITLSAVVIWDILVDLGLNSLCESNDSGLHLSESAMYDMCIVNNPDALDRYCNYKVNDAIVRECGIMRNM